MLGTGFGTRSRSPATSERKVKGISNQRLESKRKEGKKGNGIKVKAVQSELQGEAEIQGGIQK